MRIIVLSRILIVFWAVHGLLVAQMQTSPSFYVENIKLYTTELEQALKKTEAVQAALKAGRYEQAAKELSELSTTQGKANQLLANIRNSYTATIPRVRANISGPIHTAVQNLPDPATKGNVGNLKQWLSRQEAFLAEQNEKIRTFTELILQHERSSEASLEQEIQKKEVELKGAFAELKNNIEQLKQEKAQTESTKKTSELLSMQLEKIEEDVTELQQQISTLEEENEQLRSLVHTAATSAAGHGSLSSVGSATSRQLAAPLSSGVGGRTVDECEAENERIKKEYSEELRILRETNQRLVDQSTRLRTQLKEGGIQQKQPVAEIPPLKSEDIPVPVENGPPIFMGLKRIFASAQKESSLEETREEVVNVYQHLMEYQGLRRDFDKFKPVLPKTGGLPINKQPQEIEVTYPGMENSIEILAGLKKIFGSAQAGNSLEETRKTVVDIYKYLARIEGVRKALQNIHPVMPELKEEEVKSGVLGMSPEERQRKNEERNKGRAVQRGMILNEGVKG